MGGCSQRHHAVPLPWNADTTATPAHSTATIQIARNVGLHLFRRHCSESGRAGGACCFGSHTSLDELRRMPRAGPDR
jgi:hypothetical protein